MKLLGTLCMLLLFLLTGSRQVGEAEKNSALCCQAAMTLQIGIASCALVGTIVCTATAESAYYKTGTGRQ